MGSLSTVLTGQEGQHFGERQYGVVTGASGAQVRIEETDRLFKWDRDTHYA